jgi:hypothetical protein
VTKPGKVSTTDAEIEAAIERGRKHDEHATKIVRAEYDRDRDQIWAALNTGASITVPRRNLPSLDTYLPADFGSVHIEPPGYAIWFDKPDVGVRLEGLLRAAGGEGLIRSIAAQAMGSARTQKKADAARKNGIDGGRPPKPGTQPRYEAAIDPMTGHKLGRKLLPNMTAPRSGEYQIIGPRGGGNPERTIVRGEPLPPAPSAGAKYQVSRPAKNQAGKKK